MIDTTHQYEHGSPDKEPNSKAGQSRSIVIMPMCHRIQHLDYPELCESRKCQRHPEAKPFPELVKYKSDCNCTQKRHDRSVFPLFWYFDWKKVVDQESNPVSRE